MFGELIGGEAMLYLSGILVAILGALGLYTRGQHYKIKSLEMEKKEVEVGKRIAERRAEVNAAKAELHKKVARTVIQDKENAAKKIDMIHKKIDEAKDGETFTVDI